MRQDQIPLWVESFSEALKAVVFACGGPKRVASTLWPSKKPERAALDLNHCLDDGRAEKLSLEEIVLLIQMGRERGVHTPMDFLCSAANYQEPQPVDPEDERARLQREFIEAKNDFASLLKKMERHENG